MQETITVVDQQSTNDKLGLGIQGDAAAQARKVASLGVVSEASRQWSTRPSDQRYLSLEDLARNVHTRRNRSREVVKPMEHLAVRVAEDGHTLNVFDPKADSGGAALTHWSFGQISQRAGTPTGWLRTVEPELAALCMNYGLEKTDGRDDVKLLLTKRMDEIIEARAATSGSYGRIWDAEVVNAVMKFCGPETSWKVPAASYATHDPKRASTLYASDRDVFIFLVDDKNPIDVPNEPDHQMFRGFYTWNSETGSGTFGIATFLYDYVCDNRNIWGVKDFSELRIRHTAGAPERFIRQATPALQRYLESSTKDTVEVIARAQTLKLGDSIKAVKEKLAEKGFTKAQVAGALDYAERVPGDPKSLWNVQQGLTAIAREVEHSDDRVALEERAGKLMAMVG